MTLSWDKHLLKYDWNRHHKYDFDNNPSSRCRLFVPDDVLVWYLDTFHCVGLFDRTDASAWLKRMSSIKELKKLCNDQDTLRLISAPETEVVSSRRNTEFNPSWQTAWRTLLTHLNAPSNHCISELDLDAHGIDVVPSLPVADLVPVLTRLHTLKLQAIPLDSPSSVFRNGKDIVHLDLSGSVNYADGLLCLHLGLMLREWRSHPSHDRKVLVMDNVVFDTRYVSRVVSGVWEKEVGTLDAESDTSFTVTHGDGTPLIYLSLSRVILDTWLTAIDEVYSSAVDLLAVKVKMTCRTDSATLGASSLSARKKAKLPPTSSGSSPPPVALPTSVVDGYSNATCSIVH